MKNIITGFFNLLRTKLGYPSKKEWLDRLGTCLDCEYMNKNSTCNICGCYIPAKVRSKSKCPENKWNV